jgi:crossover junction endodeoxyribonuclease RusA
MSESIAFTVFGQAQPAGSKTAGLTKDGRRFYRDANPAASEWKRQVAQVAGQAMVGRPILDGAVRLSVRFFRVRPAGHYGKNGLRGSAPAFPTGKPDTTKLVRGTEDALRGTVVRDDAQVVELHAFKLYGEPARAEIVVTPMAAERPPESAPARALTPAGLFAESPS